MAAEQEEPAAVHSTVTTAPSIPTIEHQHHHQQQERDQQANSSEEETAAEAAARKIAKPPVGEGVRVAAEALPVGGVEGAATMAASRGGIGVLRSDPSIPDGLFSHRVMGEGECGPPELYDDDDVVEKKVRRSNGQTSLTINTRSSHRPFNTRRSHLPTSMCVIHTHVLVYLFCWGVFVESCTQTVLICHTVYCRQDSFFFIIISLFPSLFCFVLFCISRVLPRERETRSTDGSIDLEAPNLGTQVSYVVPIVSSTDVLLIVMLIVILLVLVLAVFFDRLGPHLFKEKSERT